MHYFAHLISISFLFFISLGIYSKNIAPEVVDWYSMRLEEEDTALKKDFKKALGITDSEWDQAIIEARMLHELYDDVFKQMCEYNGSLSHEIMHIFEKICCEKGMKNSVLALNIGNSSPVAHMKYIGLSEEFFAQFNATREEQEAAIMHEVIHVAYEDVVALLAMENLLVKATDQQRTAAFPIMCKWRLFGERRADILAGLSAPFRAQALISFYKKLEKDPNYKQIVATTHPLWSDRMQYMENLRKDIDAGKVLGQSSILQLTQGLYKALFS